MGDPVRSRAIHCPFLTCDKSHYYEPTLIFKVERLLEKRKERLVEVRSREVPVPNSTEDLLSKSKYWAHLSAISNVEDWNKKFVRKRSKRLAELVWVNIAPWLGFDEE